MRPIPYDAHVDPLGFLIIITTHSVSVGCGLLTCVLFKALHFLWVVFLLIYLVDCHIAGGSSYVLQLVHDLMEPKPIVESHTFRHPTD